MEDRQLPITVGQGAGARVVTLDLPPFTLIGATTRVGPADHAAARPLRHPAPPRALRARRPRARSSAARRAILGVEIDDDGARAIAARSRGTPRVANRLLKRVRDFAEVRGDGRRHRGRRRRGARPARGRRRGPGPARPRDPLARSARSSAAARSASRRSPSRSARSRTRSRTSTSPTCSSAGLLKRTPRGRVRDRRAPSRHLGLEAPARGAPACSEPCRARC